MTDPYDPLELLYEAESIPDRLIKADLPSEIASSTVPTDWLAIPSAIYPTGNWNIGTSMLGIQVVLNGAVSYDPPPGRLAFRSPPSQRYSDYAETYNQTLNKQVATVWQPVLESLKEAIRTTAPLVTYRMPSTPITTRDERPDPYRRKSTDKIQT